MVHREGPQSNVHTNIELLGKFSVGIPKAPILVKQFLELSQS